jgi:hypothetical protein
MKKLARILRLWFFAVFLYALLPMALGLLAWWLLVGCYLYAR